MNPLSKTKLAQLHAMVADLVNAIGPIAYADAGQRRSIEETVVIISCYRDMISDALAAGSAEAGLRGANAATGINKGVADTAWAHRFPQIGHSASRIQDFALETAGLLRADLGMDF